MELSLPVIAACLKELCQYVITVGSAYEPSYRQSHLKSKISCHNIAEVSGRDDIIDLITVIDPAGAEELAVRREVIYYLRYKSSYIYRVGA